MTQTQVKSKVPKNSIPRLSLYLRELTRLEKEGKKTISSAELAELTDLTDTQIRKDIAYAGQIGISGTGYEIIPLNEAIKKVLGKDKVWDVILVGVGNLGTALLSYPGFKDQGFAIKGAFDINTRKFGQKIGNAEISDIEKMSEFIKEEDIKIALLAAPEFSAQKITDTLVSCGIKCILNFAPIILKVPEDVLVSNVDLSRELEIFSYFIKSNSNA